jgi:hypothetical protein
MIKTTDKLTYTDVLKDKRRFLLAFLQQHGQDEDKCYQSDGKPSRNRQDLIVSNKTVLDSNTDSTDKVQPWARGVGFEPTSSFEHGISNPTPYQARRPPLLHQDEIQSIY